MSTSCYLGPGVSHLGNSVCLMVVAWISTRGVTRGGKIPREPNHYGGRRVTAGCGKVPTISQVGLLPSIKYIFEHGGQTCFLPRAPTNLVTLLMSTEFVL